VYDAAATNEEVYQVGWDPSVSINRDSYIHRLVSVACFSVACFTVACFTVACCAWNPTTNHQPPTTNHQPPTGG
jgi:hypothetical protein